MFLVQLHPEKLLEQCSKTKRLDAQELRGNASVENAVDMPAVILVEKSQIIVGIMKHHLDLGILKNVTECLRHSDGKRIDYRASFARRQLQKINSVDEPVEARSLSIDGDLPHLRDVGEKIVRRLPLIDV